MPIWIGPAIKWGIILALVLTGWSFLRWGLRRAEKSQADRDEVDRLRRERAEDQKKLRAAIAAEEERRAAHRDPVTGLPSELGLQPRPKPDQRPVGEPPAGGPPQP